MSLIKKPTLSFLQIINMNVGFFGIQYSFGLQQSAVNPIYDMLGAHPDQIPLLNLAGPVTGLIIQPLIGALSDGAWHPKYGRRKPYFMIGALCCSIALFLFPFSSSLWMAAGLLWILDAGNNTAMEPYRAFVADKLDESQQSTGFQAQSFFTGFGQTLANLSLFIFPLIIVGKTGKLPNWVYASFFLGACCSVLSIWWSIHTTKEIPPTNDEIKIILEKNKNKVNPFIQFFLSIIIITILPIILWLVMNFSGFNLYANIITVPVFLAWIFFLNYMSHHISTQSFAYILIKIIHPFLDIIDAIKTMPTVMWRLALVYLFQWYALFCYWQNSSKSIALSIFNTSPEANPKLYEKAVSWAGLVNGWYNIVTFLCAFALIILVKKWSAKYTHFICLLLAAIGLLFFPFIHQKYLLFPAITGFGIGWASMMGIPYIMIVNQIPKEKYGVYMGIINMMIVIPMIIQNLTFGYVLKNFLNNDARYAIVFAGVFLIIAAMLTLLINKNNNIEKSTN